MGCGGMDSVLAPQRSCYFNLLSGSLNRSTPQMRSVRCRRQTAPGSCSSSTPRCPLLRPRGS